MRRTIFWRQRVSQVSPSPKFSDNTTNDLLLARDANAGGYCHRGEDTNGWPTRRVWFSDEFTPRYEWTWGGGHFLGSAAIRYHCWQRCACARNPTKEDMTSSLFGTPVMRLSTDFWIEENNKDRSMTLNAGGDRTAPHHPKGTMNVLPAQTVARNRLNPDEPPAGTCCPDKRQFCPMKWPKAIGPIPQTPVGATQIIKAPTFVAAPSDNFTQCGQYCHKPQDCGSSNADDHCFCAVRSPQDARTLGLDVVAPVPVCLVLAGLAVTSLAGRDVIKYLDERGLEYECPCNGTYTHTACCGSKDGTVWEQ